MAWRMYALYRVPSSLFMFSLLRDPGVRYCMYNPGVPKCDEGLLTLETEVQQRKTMNNKFFIM